MKIFNKLIFWIFGIAFLVSCRDDMAPQLPEPVVETPEVGERAVIWWMPMAKQ